MGLPAIRLLSWEEYVALQETSIEKLEYLDGVVYNMTGGTFNHAALQSETITTLSNQLRGRPCRVLSSDMRLRVTSRNAGLYPDASIVCGRPELRDHGRTLLNPLVIVEVLSPSTEEYDRGAKFAQYAQLPSLREYLLIDTTRASIEQRVREEDGSWSRTQAGPGEHIQLRAVPAQLDVDALYAGLELAP